MAEVKPTIDLREYVGQPKVVQVLLEQIKGAKALGHSLQHILMLGNSGLGKTALARSISQEIGTKIYEVAGTKDFNLYAISKLAETFQPFEILFIDEIHATSDTLQLCLQRLITDGVAPKFEKDILTGRLKQSGEKKIPSITLIAATDRPGHLLKALRSRFGQPLLLVPYTIEEMRKIVRVLACRVMLALTDDATTIVANISKGIPRNAEKHLTSLQNFAAANEITDIAANHVRDFLRLYALDPIGLSDLELAYLKHLQQFQSVGAKLHSLASILSIDATYLQREVEPALQQLGLLHIDGRRYITLEGIKHLRNSEL